MNTLIQKLLSYQLLFWVYFLVPQLFFLPSYVMGDYNNYKIFSSSFLLLIQHQNLYIPHPEYYCDLYRYTPTFAVGMFPFAYLPESIGLLIWIDLNTLILYYAIYKIFYHDPRVGTRILWFILPELITTIQNVQSNGLVNGLFLLSFYYAILNPSPAKSAFFSLLNLFIKIYGFFSFAFVIFSKNIKNHLFYVFIFFLILFLSPCLFISYPELINLYKHEFSSIFSYSAGLSLMAFLNKFHSSSLSYLAIEIIGLVTIGILIFILYVFRIKDTPNMLHLLALCLMFLVLFNPMAESPTFVFGVTGAAFYIFNFTKQPVQLILAIMVLMFTSLAPSDIYPAFIRKQIFEPYKIKLIPVLFVYLHAYTMLFISAIKTCKTK